MNNDKLQQKYYLLRKTFKEKEAHRESLVYSAFSKIEPEVDKIDKDIAILNDKMSKLYDKIMQGLLESDDFNY